MNIRKILYSVIIVSSMIIGVGCGETSETDIEDNTEVKYEVAEGGEITLPLIGYKNLNPFLSANKTVYDYSRLIYEGLFKTGENLEPLPNLVEEFVIGEDAQSIEIKLKENILWHDGQKLTAEDVDYTIYWIKSNLTDENLSELYKPGNLYDMGIIKGTEVISESTIRIDFNGELGDALEYLTFPIVPKHIFNGLEIASMAGSQVIGTGSYKYSEEDDKNVAITKNENYWGEKAHIEKVYGKIFKNMESYNAGFESGLVTVMIDNDYNWRQYAQDDKVSIKKFASNNYETVGFNNKKEYFKGEEGKEFRRAISYAISKKQILKDVYKSDGVIANTPINPNSWLSIEANIEESDYNLEEAKKILGELGYSDSNEDGILEDEKGKKLSLTIITNPTNYERVQTANIVEESLVKLGIEVKKNYSEKVVPAEDLQERTRLLENFKESLLGESYDIAIMGYKTSYLPDLTYFYHSNGEGNVLGYSDPELDKLIELSGRIISKEEKQKVYTQIQEYFIENTIELSLLYKEGAIIKYERIVGDFDSSFVSAYEGINNMFVPKEFQYDKKQ